METQTDSIDISQLRAFALGLENGPPLQRVLSPPNATERQRDIRQPKATGAKVVTAGQSSTHIPRPQIAIESELWPGSLPQSRPQDSRDPGQHQSASQPELPSTIPDSLKGKMLADDSQSQGDTQKLSPSVYEYYSKESRDARAAQEIFLSTNNALDTQDSEPQSSQQGDTGHVDLLAMFEQPSMDGAGALPMDDEEDDIDPLSQDVRADIFPESRRFQAPKTPASQGHKRKREVETSSEGHPAPKLPTNPFAGQMGSVDGLMGASQLFQATQAQTSPMTNIIPSDGLSDRPSPDMHFHRPSTVGTLSSPARAPRLNTVRPVTEPQATYTTMKESQEARERQGQVRKTEQALLSDDLSDEDFAEDTQLRRRLRQQRYSEEAKVQFASVAARSEAALRGRGRGARGQTATTPSRLSSRKRGRQASEPVLISDDVLGEDGQGSITEDETEREESLERPKEDDIDELAEENKENVEVPRTVSRAHHTTSQVISSQPTPSHARAQKRNAGSQTRNAAHVESSSQPTSLRETRLIETGTQPDAIADSQLSQHIDRSKPTQRRPGTRAFSEPRSSLDARILVPQSQSSESSRALRQSISVRDEQAVSTPSHPTSSNPPQKEDSASVVAPGSSHVQNRGAEEGADARLLPTSRSSDVQSRLEGTLGSQSKVAETSAPTCLPIDSTIPNTENSTERISSAGGPVPDSSSTMPSPRTTPTKPVSIYSATLQSRESTLFETAPERPTSSPSKSYPQRMLQKSQSKQSSPLKSWLPRTISEIAADPSPPDAIGDVDIDIDILSNDDREFQKVVNGCGPVAPPLKLRKGAHGLALQITEPGPSVLPPLPGTPRPPPSSAISVITPIPSSSPSNRRTPAVARMATRNDDSEKFPPSSTPTDKLTQKQAPATKVASTSKQGAKRPSTKISDMPQTTKTGELKPAAPQVPQSSGEPVARQADPATSGLNPVTAPNRVFAHFNGSNPAYYPATCLELIGGEEPRYRVRFDDGTVDTISAYGIKRLELKAGDVIKIDVPGARTKSYTVDGVRDQQRPATLPDPETPSRRGRKHSTNIPAFPETDVHGYATVLASAKQRVSMDGSQAETNQVAVPLTQIYLTQTLWTAFKNRQYSHMSNTSLSFTGLQTPSERPSTPSTPSSRTRRIKASGLTQSRSATTGIRAGGGLFKNMVFAITNIDRIEDSKRVKDRILSNSGVILDNGFDELFNIPTLNRITSPKTILDPTFHLTSKAQNVGFTCLIADKHCRRAKFIQALALGIPCLATRWVSDCVAKQRVLPWTPYLLPSGESAFLGGAVRSRNLQSFSADTAMLANIVDNRPQLLKDASVLLIMEKGQEDIMKQHPLITHALGASEVCRAVSVDAAAKAAADAQALGEPWDWVFSYDKEKEVEKRLFRGSSTGRKRKRGRESEVREPPIKNAKTKVVGNEFVIQSVILGMLIDH